MHSGVFDARPRGLYSQGMARAGEVKLLSALVMKPALAELAASFERTSGHKLAIAYDSAGAVTKRIQSGEAADVAIIQRPTIERLIKEGKIASGSNVILARSGVAVAVRHGHRFGRCTQANVAGS